MSKGHGRRTAGAAATAVLALLLAGCGGGGGGDGKADAPASPGGGAATSATPGAAGGDQTPSTEPTQILAQIKGGDNVVVTITSAVRDQGGYVTIQGTVTNNGTKAFNAVAWRGEETAVVKSGASVAGAVLVDEAGKKRYYVLRDTDGLCLCTMDLIGVQPKESRPIFAQFPAPPPTTTSVDFELPTMPPAQITISEG
ncbi:hypothetical protein GA0115240_114223 [Streptomyces sp. DvalAA-14]|uniref:hypothetical protein n=1 Tax=unclassified Streptomyces TaxID=2593676 RepID=UPI00081B5F85|nr:MULTISPECIES: hypothetical protein [unclassified Streptomyces]MYS19852.1 hypothetical protein [Streptomyces sp. SID4948]SCD54854.1 hypothetical protein GA0115240_114223 [Streptomyces sp. DvalAA-14]